MFYTFFKKLVIVITIISLLPLNAFAMKDDNDDGKLDITVNQQRSIDISENIENKENQQPPALNRDPTHETRANLNKLLEKVIAPTEIVYFGENKPLVNANESSEDKIPMVSGVVIYNRNKPIIPEKEEKESFQSVLKKQNSKSIVEDLNKKKQEGTLVPDKWDQLPFFFEELDKIFFNQNISKKTRLLQLITFLGGGLIARGWAPLVMFLAENILGFIPVGGKGAEVLVFSIMAITALPCAMQISERVGIICNYLFDKLGFKPRSEGYKGPGIQKLKTEKQVTCNKLLPPLKWCTQKKCFSRDKCCHLTIPFYLEVVSTVFSYASAILRATPFALLFWEAEEYFPEFRAIFIAPIFLIYFERTLKDSMAFWGKFFHKQLTGNYPMAVLKKQVLHSRLDEMSKRLNLPRSDDLVAFLHDKIEEELKNKKEGEHVSAFSFLFLKRYGVSSLEDLQEGLKETSHPFTVQEEGKELKEVVEQIHTVPMQGYANLFEDLGTLPSQPKLEDILKKIADLGQGAATIGRLLTTLWSVQKFMKYCGIDETTSFYTGLGVSIVDVIVRAVCEWYLQEETFAKVQHIASTKTSYWGLKYFTGALASIGSFFFSLAPVAIIFRILGKTTPLYVKVMIAAVTYPTEFSSLFRFIKEKYDNFITTLAIRDIVLCRPKTIRQKRAWLNYYIEKAHKFIDEADATTTEDFYSASQEGV